MTTIPRAEASAMQEALPAILMRIVSELHDVAYLIERIEPQLLDLSGVKRAGIARLDEGHAGHRSGRTEDARHCRIHRHHHRRHAGGWMVDVATALSLVKLAEMQKALGGSASSRTLAAAWPRPPAISICSETKRRRLIIVFLILSWHKFFRLCLFSCARRNARTSFDFYLRCRAQSHFGL